MDCVSCIDLSTVSYNYRTIVPIFSVLQVWKLVKCVAWCIVKLQDNFYKKKIG